MFVSGVSLRDFRNYEAVELELGNGMTVVHGPIGAGKTNLLEAIYLGCVGRSWRSSAERELVRFGERAARVAVDSSNGSAGHRYEVVIQPGTPRQLKVDGVRRGLAMDLHRPLVCVFVPDRLELVKGPAARRRAHLDALVAALWPIRRATRAAYGRALAQRNALLARVRRGSSAPSSLKGWDHELARHGVELMADRECALGLLTAAFVDRGDGLGLPAESSVQYKPRSRAGSAVDLEAELEGALEADLERGFTTHGPHRDDFAITTAGRDVRRFGSQGQQRLALLALLLAEREALKEARGSTPLLLLDDVLSELDRERREALLAVVQGEGQTLITTADRGALDAGALAEVRVESGTFTTDGEDT